MLTMVVLQILLQMLVAEIMVDQCGGADGRVSGGADGRVSSCTLKLLLKITIIFSRDYIERFAGRSIKSRSRTSIAE